MMRVSPRAFRARTRLDPTNPAAPVTTMVMSSSVLRKRREKLLRLNDRRSELPDHDSARLVGHAHRVAQRHAGAEHHAQRRDDSVPRAAHVEYLARPGGLVAAPARLIERHALFAP